MEVQRAKWIRRAHTGLTLLTAAIVLNGCAVLPRTPVQTQIPTAVSPSNLPPAAETLGRGNEDAETEIITKQDGAELLQVDDLEPGDPLPALPVNGLSLSNLSLFEAIRLLVADAPMTIAIDKNVLGGQVGVLNLQGTMQDALNVLSESFGFFFTYHNKVLRISPDKQFIIALPPVEETFNGIADILANLGASQVKLDKVGRVVTFRASRPVYRKIKSYLDYIRRNKVLVVYDTYVWEVELTDKTAAGIDWSKFTYTNGSLSVGLSGLANTTGGLAVSTIYNSSHFAVDTLAKFLRTQGNLHTISQPKITLISGGKSTFRVGKTTRYIAQVGTTVTGTTGVTQTTATVDKILSGLDITLSADVDAGTVYTQVKLAANDLVRFDDFTALGTVLKLPQESNRELETSVRVRPGDSILLGGINIERDSRDVSGIPGPDRLIPFLKDTAKETLRSELVIVLRPRLIRFTGGN